MYTHRSFFREFAACLGLLFIGALWFAAIEWIFPLYFNWDDNATFYGPVFLFNALTLMREHSVPLIDFFQFAGWNHLGAGQTGVLYPPAYIAAWLAIWLKNPLLTTDLLCMLHLTGGMFAMYAWLRTLTLRQFFAMAGAVLYLTLPFTTIVSRSWIVVSYAHFFAPLCLLFLERDLQKTSVRNYAGYVLAKTAFVFTGYPQYIAYQTLIEALYIGIRQRKKFRTMDGKIFRFGHANLLTFILSLPILLPMWEATQLSFSRAQSLPFLTRFAGMTDFLHVFTAQFFHFYKHPVSTIIGFNTIFLIGGSIFLPWIFAKAFAFRKQPPASLVTTTILCFIAFLCSNVFNLLLGLLPIFNRFRWSFKFYVYVGLFYITAFFLTLQWLHEKKRLGWKSIVLILAAALLSHTVVLPSPPIADFRLHTIASPLPEYVRGNYRTVAITSSDAIFTSISTLPLVNYGTLWNTPALTGYDPLVSRMAVAISGDVTRFGIGAQKLDTGMMTHFSRWSVRYLIANEALSPLTVQKTGLRLIESHPLQFIYENRDALPVAAFVNARTIPVPLEYHANRIRLHTAGKTGAVFVRLNPIDGYTLRHGNGSTETIVKAESGIVLAINNPEQNVDIIYESIALEKGMKGTIIGILFFMMCALVLWLWNRQGRKQ